MFRKMYFVLVLLLCLSLVMGISCAVAISNASAESADERVETDGSADAQEKTLLEKLRTTVQMPDVYLITYSVEDEDGTVKFISYGRDASGRYYLSQDGVEALYVPEGDYYYRAGLADRAFTLEHIEKEAEQFMEYAKGSLWQYASGAEYIGTEVFCGRSADVYEIERDIAIYRNVSRFAVDRETGVCLYTVEDSVLMGHELDPARNVICTQFLTQDVVLPGTEGE